MIEVVSAHPDDWTTWRNVRLRALTGDPDAFSSSLENWRDQPESRWRTRLVEVPCNLLAMRAGSPVGQVSADDIGLFTEDGPQRELIGLWVAPEARGLAVGDALVAAVAQWAGEVGATSVGLDVRRDNLPAQTLYARHGFTVVGSAHSAACGRDDLRMVAPVSR